MDKEKEEETDPMLGIDGAVTDFIENAGLLFNSYCSYLVHKTENEKHH